MPTTEVVDNSAKNGLSVTWDLNGREMEGCEMKWALTESEDAHLFDDQYIFEELYIDSSSCNCETMTSCNIPYCPLFGPAYGKFIHL